MQWTIEIAKLTVVMVALLPSSCSMQEEKKDTTGDSDQQGQVAITAEDKVKIAAAFAPLPTEAASTENPVTPLKVALGKRLFLDEALSNPLANNGQRISCNTCHLLDNFGVDGLDRSLGILGEKVPVNAPSVFNAALHTRQFWDGRAKDVEEQALGPITALKEMGFTNSDADKATVLAQLVAADASYPQQFVEAFGGDEAAAFTFANIGQAIGAFERTLLTPSRFDSYLKGDDAALSGAEKRGLKLFMTVGGKGCVSCHSGVAVGGQQLVTLAGKPSASDPLVQAAYAGAPAPVKVPSLRNAEKTGPYFHNGAIANLEDAIRAMATYELGVTLRDEETMALKAFLQSLTGEVPASAL
jgi:cytochrome c peroxidase